MGEERKRAIAGERLDPERDLRELHCGRVEIYAVEAVLDDAPFAPRRTFFFPTSADLCRELSVGIESSRGIAVGFAPLSLEEMPAQEPHGADQEVGGTGGKIDHAQTLDLGGRLVFNERR